MREITESDWKDIGNLAERISYPSERIIFLKRRLETNAPRNGAPLVLIAGMPKCGIELLLSRLLKPEVAEELEKSTRPLVIGKSPATVQPKIGSWATVKSSSPEAGHFIALRTEGKPPADTLAQIASLGYVDQAVLVTRLGQPLQMKERELAQSLGSLAATMRVLVVGLPSEEATASELAEVSSYAASRMRLSGFDDGRFLGASVWFTDSAARSGAITDVKGFFKIDQINAESGRSGMIQHALSQLFADLRQRAENAPITTVSANLSDDDKNRLVQELNSYLADLGREVERQKQVRRLTNTDTLRRYVMDAVRGWGAYTGVEGHWLRYVEQVKPGTQADLMKETEAAAALLDYEAGSNETAQRAEHHSGKTSSNDYFAVLAKRAALAVIGGIVAVILAATLFIPAGASVMSFVSGVALIVGAAIGYFLATFIFQTPKPKTVAESQRFVETAKPAAVNGWTEFERRLMTWFSERIREKQRSPIDEWHTLAQRLQIKENKL